METGRQVSLCREFKSWFSFLITPGTITVADDLDYEVCKDFFLKVEAVDGGTPPLKTSTIVTIEVMDINDNAPSFSEDIYNVLISEDAAIGETVIRVLFYRPCLYSFISTEWAIEIFTVSTYWPSVLPQTNCWYKVICIIYFCTSQDFCFLFKIANI